MADERKIERFEAREYLRVIRQDTGEMLGSLVDISPEGFQILTEVPIEIGAKFDLEIEIPQNISETDGIRLVAACVWCRKSSNPSFYYAGLQIQNLTNEIKDAVRSIINSSMFINGFSLTPKQ